MVVVNKGNFSSGINSGRGPSPNLWTEAVLSGLLDKEKGCLLFDDFLSFNGTVSANVGTYASQGGGYKSYEDTGNSIAGLATEVGGVIRISTDGTDNDESWLSPNVGFAKINTLANSGTKLIFEARIRPNQIATGNWAIGMTEESRAAADFITDAGAFGDFDFVGARVLEDDSDGLDFTYRTSGAAEVVHKNVAAALTAAAWIKFGFVFDPNDGLRYFVNGLEIAGVDKVLASATGFPDGEELCPIIGIKNSTAAANTIDLDWWQVGYLFS